MAKSPNRNMIMLAYAGALALFILAAHFPVQVFHTTTTLQSVVAIFISFLLGWRAGLIVGILYVVVVICGLPPLIWGLPSTETIFLGGKSNGYLLGLILAGTLPGLISPEGRGALLRVFFAIIIGHLAYLALGILWLCRFVSPPDALAQGFYPYLVPVMVKSVAVFITMVCIRRFTKI